MRGITHIIDADGDTIHGIHYTPLTLEFMQTCVGGPIEVVPHFTTYMSSRCVAFCNEEGKLRDLPVNKEATMLWRQQFNNPDILVGNILIVTGDEEFMESL
jgi:hypothetical protein